MNPPDAGFAPAEMTDGELGYGIVAVTSPRAGMEDGAIVFFDDEMWEPYDHDAYEDWVPEDEDDECPLPGREYAIVYVGYPCLSPTVLLHHEYLRPATPEECKSYNRRVYWELPPT